MEKVPTVGREKVLTEGPETVLTLAMEEVLTLPMENLLDIHTSARAWQIQERLGIPACFCAPRHPWEKGTNENTNGLLRDFFPKGRSLDGATYAMLNRRPRRRLGWNCPQEVFCSQALHLL